MIVRELMIKLGFRADTGGADKIDGKLLNIKRNSIAVGTMLGQLGASMARMGMQAVTDHMRASVEAADAFSRGMGKIQTLLPAGAAQAGEFADAIGRMSTEMGVSSADISAGMYDVISTFGATRDTITQTNMAVKAGIAGNGTTADGIALLGAVTKAYGDTSATTMQKVSDLGFTTVNLGKVTLPELAGSIGRVTPMAATLGISLEELNATFATFTGVTGGGAEVSTQFASVLRAMVDRTPAMQKAFKKAFGTEGITTMKDALAKHGLQGTLQALTATTDGTAEGIQRLFGRAEAMTLALAMTGKQAGDYKDKLRAMNGAQGATDAAYRANTEGLAKNAHALDVARQKAEEQKRALGEQLVPTYIEATVLMGEMTRALTDQAMAGSGSGLPDLIRDIREVADTIAILLRMMGAPVIAIVNTLAKAVDGVRDVAHGDVTQGLGKLSKAALSGVTTAATFGVYDVVDQGMAGYDAMTAARAKRDLEQRKNEERDAANARFYAREEAGGRAAAARALLAPVSRAAGSSFQSTVGAVNVNVTVPAGTEASAAATIGTTGARALLQQQLANARRSFPVQAPAGG